MSITTKSKGVSLIEVVIAMYVFGVGILVILRMLMANIGRLYDIRTKDTAVSFAKEGIDIVFHQRDSNIEKGMPWNCAGIIYSGGDRECVRDFLNGSTSGTYIVSRPVTGLYYLEPLVGTARAQLRYHSGVIIAPIGSDNSVVWYNHETTGGTPSEFSRWINFTPLSLYPTKTGYVLQVKSVVQYTRGTRVKQVILESVVGDMR